MHLLKVSVIILLRLLHNVKLTLHFTCANYQTILDDKGTADETRTTSNGLFRNATSMVPTTDAGSATTNLIAVTASTTPDAASAATSAATKTTPDAASAATKTTPDAASAATNDHVANTTPTNGEAVAKKKTSMATKATNKAVTKKKKKDKAATSKASKKKTSTTATGKAATEKKKPPGKRKKDNTAPSQASTKKTSTTEKENLVATELNKMPAAEKEVSKCQHEVLPNYQIEENRGYFTKDYLEKNPIYPRKCCGKDSITGNSCDKEFGKNYKVGISSNKVYLCPHYQCENCLHAYCSPCFNALTEKKDREQGANKDTAGRKSGRTKRARTRL